MKKQERREEKGITLVALVVTIIVLIILAGVTLNIVLDNDGIINKAKQAADDYENAQREEQELLGQIEKYLNPPIPDGYVASSVPGENIVSSGLVIYEGDEPVTEENHEESMLNRNQYVWIPVDDINSMVMCSSNTGESICNLVYDEETNTLECTNPEHASTATDLVGRLYVIGYKTTTDNEGNNIYSNDIDFIKRDQIYDTSSYHEPATVTGEDGISYDGDSSNLKIAGMPEGSTADDFLTQLKSDFTTMAKSVAKNGGFYISRYEVGANGDSKKNQKVLTATNSDGSDYLGANTWYGLYGTIRKIDENKQMIWGCQYDQVIKFIGEEAQTGHTDRNLTTEFILSGQNLLDKMKNIYDLEGNHYEWTVEASNFDHRSDRGGGRGYLNSNIYRASSHRGSYYPNQIATVYTSRSIFYL